MNVRHDTRLLEAAIRVILDRAQIPAQQARRAAELASQRAGAIRRLAAGGAIALAAIGIGLGIFISLQATATPRSESPAGPSPQDERKAKPPVVPTPLPPGQSPQVEREPGHPEAQAPSPPKTPERQPPAQRGQITRNYQVFQNKMVSIGGYDWTVSAGHHFQSNEDPVWLMAWCYTETTANGIALKIDLVNRPSVSASPKGVVATTETLRAAGLTNENALQLAVNCPWLDKKEFSPSDFTLQKVTAPVCPFETYVLGEPRRVCRKADGVLHYAGLIDEQFEAIVRQNDFATLALTSEGGFIDTALRVGRYLRSGSVNVNVEGDCLSACVLVVAGGIDRSVTRPAQIGVHRFYSEAEMTGEEGMEQGQRVSSEIVTYLQDMGVDQRLFQAMSSVDRETMWYLSESDLREWRLLTQNQSAGPDAGSASTGWHVQLGAVSSHEGVNALLNKAKASLGTEFASLRPVTQEVEYGGTILYRARLAGFSNKEEARKTCQKLKHISPSCFVVPN